MNVNIYVMPIELKKFDDFMNVASKAKVCLYAVPGRVSQWSVVKLTALVVEDGVPLVYTYMADCHIIERQAVKRYKIPGEVRTWSLFELNKTFTTWLKPVKDRFHSWQWEEVGKHIQHIAEKLAERDGVEKEWRIESAIQQYNKKEQEKFNKAVQDAYDDCINFLIEHEFIEGQIPEPTFNIVEAYA